LQEFVNLYATVGMIDRNVRKKISLRNSSEVEFLYSGCLCSPCLCAGDGDILLPTPDSALRDGGGGWEGCAAVLCRSCTPSLTWTLQKLLPDFWQTQNSRLPNYEIKWDELKTAFFFFTILA